MWSAAPGVRCPTSRRSSLTLEVVGERLARGERALADEHADRRLARRRQVREPPGRPPLARAVPVDHVGDVGRARRRAASRARASRSPDRRRRCAAGRAPRRGRRAAGRTRPRGRARRGARRPGRRARARPRRRDVARPRRPSRPAAATSRGSCGGQPGGSVSGTSDPSATYSSAKCRENSCATASISRHSSAVTSRASSPKRSSSARLSRSPRSASGHLTAAPSIPKGSTGSPLALAVDWSTHVSSVLQKPSFTE